MACGGVAKSGSPMVSAMTSAPCSRNARARAVMATVAAILVRASRSANAGMAQARPAQNAWMRRHASRRLSVSVA